MNYEVMQELTRYMPGIIGGVSILGVIGIITGSILKYNLSEQRKDMAIADSNNEYSLNKIRAGVERTKAITKLEAQRLEFLKGVFSDSEARRDYLDKRGEIVRHFLSDSLKKEWKWESEDEFRAYVDAAMGMPSLEKLSSN